MQRVFREKNINVDAGNLNSFKSKSHTAHNDSKGDSFSQHQGSSHNLTPQVSAVHQYRQDQIQQMLQAESQPLIGTHLV